MKRFSLDKLFSLLFGLLVFLFFAFIYPFHLNYLEQYQLFLFTDDYFFQFLEKPGGFSDYLGIFFTQFFFYSWIGSIIIALLLVILQRTIWFISNKIGVNPVLQPLTFIPSILYWSLLCDENYLLGGLIALLLTSIFIAVYMLLESIVSRISFVLISIPVLFWVAGGIFLLLPVFAIVRELFDKKMKRRNNFLFLLSAVSLSMIIPVICKIFFLQYPIRRVLVGVNYYRFPNNIPVTVILIGVLTILIPFFIHYMSLKLKNKKNVILNISQLLFLFLGSWFFINRSVDISKEEVMAYDFYVRMRKWDQVIALAENKAPSSPLSVTCLNLALAKQGLLPDKMFSYYQRGIQGLLPDFIRDYTIPMITGEVYYHLGLINTAQRYAFEAMEALPDYQKSVRAIKRLAETNLINGEYEVSRKYLRLLQKTMYYRGWATEALASLENEKVIEQHVEWGWLRKCRTEEDFLFSKDEKDMMLGVLFTHNTQNQMAYEYLMAYYLLNKDLQKFIQYFSVGKSIPYKTIPKSYQEALIYIWSVTNHSPSEKIPYKISNQVIESASQYQNLFSNNYSESMLKGQYSDTYWYYLNFRK